MQNESELIKMMKVILEQKNKSKNQIEEIHSFNDGNMVIEFINILKTL